MKRNLLIISLALCAVAAWGQENMVTISGGYSFANIEDTDIKGTGWRINGLYEFNPRSSMFAHGFSFGYISLSGTDNSVTNTVNSFPLYYAPKVMFGNDKIKAFCQGCPWYAVCQLLKEKALSN